MDYYEELGIERSATKEDISQAHRRLTKLLHPDQQTDEAIKLLADKQMRRLNSIIEVLLDPERRFRYDQHLQFISAASNPSPNEHPFRPIVMPSQRFEWLPSRKTFLLCISSAVVGGILMMCALLLWSNDWGGSSAYDDHRVATTQSAPAATAPTTSENSSMAGSSTRSVLHPSTSPMQDAQTPQLARNTPPSLAPFSQRSTSSQPPSPAKPELSVKTAKTVDGASSSAPAPIRSQSPAPALAASKPALAASKTPVSNAPPATSTAAAEEIKSELEGNWVYAPAKKETSDPGYYAPEFIHLKLSSKGKGLEGAYEAHYVGVPKSISPDVAFSLATSDHQSQKFIWQSPSGSRGTFRVSLLKPDKLRIDWRTTVSSTQQGLTSGVATLVRQNP